MTAERRGNADDDGVAFGEAVEIDGCRSTVAREGLADAIDSDMPDVGFARAEHAGLPRIDIEADHREAPFLEQQEKGQPDVA